MTEEQKARLYQERNELQDINQQSQLRSMPK